MSHKTRAPDEIAAAWPAPLRLTHAEQVSLARSRGLKELDVLILKALSHGLNEAEAGTMLSYSRHHVKDRMGHVRPALRAKTNAQAVANALRQGLIA